MGVHIASFLGCSEVGPGLCIILPFDTSLAVRERCIGYPLPGTEAWVIDPATGDELPSGEIPGRAGAGGLARHPRLLAEPGRDGAPDSRRPSAYRRPGRVR